MKTTITVPHLGDSSEATVAAIIKETGSIVSNSEEILELETEKVNQVIYAPQGGIIQLDVKVGDTVKIGQAIGYINDTMLTTAEDGLELSNTKEEPDPSEEKKPLEDIEEQYDVIVIGGGPAGYIASIYAAKQGLKTACIDDKDYLGGTCLNEGCIPSKTLLHTSELFHQLQSQGLEHGLKYSELSIDQEQMLSHKRDVLSSLGKGIASLYKKYAVTRIQGKGRLLKNNVVEVTYPEETTYSIQGKHIILAMGSQAIALPSLPFDEEKILSSTGALNLTKIPDRLVVVGAGAIGIELASVYARLGSAVTIVELMDNVCPGFDKTVSRTLQRILVKEGMLINLSTKITKVKKNKDDIIEITLDDGEEPSTIEAEAVLVAIGRRPATKSDWLKDLGIGVNARGFIIVDKEYRTSIPNVYAIGDLVPGPMLAHKASADAIAVIDGIIGNKNEVNYNTIPNVVYTSPEVASVGKIEEELNKENRDIVTATSYFRGNSRARCNDDFEGFVKIVAEANTLRILGMQIIGPYASELISIGTLALELNATAHDLVRMTFPHPTCSEAIKEAALAMTGKAIHG